MDFEELMLSYPEMSPLDHKPPIPGVFVTSAIRSYSPEEREQARITTLDRGINPHRYVYGHLWPYPKDDYDATAMALPPPPPSSPLKRVRIDLPTLKFVKDISRGRESGAIWKISINGKFAALKLVCII
jgi:hypothetical protein